MHVRIASYACQNFISSTRCTPLRGFSRRHRRSATLTHTHIYALNSNKAFNARTHARIHRVLSSKYRNRAPLLSYAIARLNYKLTLRVTIIITDLKIDTIYKAIKATTTTIRTTRILMKNFFCPNYVSKDLYFAQKNCILWTDQKFRSNNTVFSVHWIRVSHHGVLFGVVGAKVPSPTPGSSRPRSIDRSHVHARRKELRRVTRWNEKRGGEPLLRVL